MKLSIQKIDQFIALHGFSVRRVFTGIKEDIYLEVISRSTMDVFFVRISKRYEITLDFDTYPIVNFTFKEKDLTAQAIVKDMYSLPAELFSSNPEQLYQVSITAQQDIAAQEKKANKILQQTKRVKYCVRNSHYRLALTSGNIICIMHSPTNCALYKGESPFLQSLYLIIDFTPFYNRISLIATEIQTMVTGLETLFCSNEKIHANNVQSMLEDKYSFASTYAAITQMQTEYDQYIDKYKTLLENLNAKEKDKYVELQHLNSTTNRDRIHVDIKQSHQKQLVETELKNLVTKRRKTEDMLLEIKVKKTNLCLEVDNILFNCTVTFTRLVEQINQFAELLKN